MQEGLKRYQALRVLPNKYRAGRLPVFAASKSDIARDDFKGFIQPMGNGIRLGLFGGSFDPVHLGHLLVAQAAMEELALSQITFIPAARSPFKPEQTAAPFPLRARWLRLALAGHSHFELDLQEVSRDGISYTIDTLRDYSRRYPGAKLHYIIGADHVAQLPLWRDAAELASLAEMVVVPRPGCQPVSLPEPFRGTWLRGWPIDFSSSQIRQRVSEALPIGHMVPSGVEESILDSRVYSKASSNKR